MKKTGLITAGIFILSVFFVISCNARLLAKEPDLPQGLNPPDNTKEEAPPLPAGLQQSGSAQEPALPQGLQKDESREEPELPAGLGTGSAEEPPLPSGLSSDQTKGPQQTAKARPSGWWEHYLPPVHGFLEARYGPRLQPDPTESKDYTLGETRFQLKTHKYWDAGTLEVTADTVLDGVTEDVDFDLRKARFTFSPLPSIDIWAGRQVLSWGTGDLLFINDLFPKDWVSFLSGRDVEYLKAPGNAVRIGWFNDLFNLNLVYTPRFDPDRYVDGERLSYWNQRIGAIAGDEDTISADEPDDWFTDDEIALRVYRNLSGYQLALYGYFGYWKSPAGQDPATGDYLFPKLNVYGASAQGTLGPGIGNIEFGYYDSREDRSGDNPLVNNSEFRFLIGYELELAREFTGSFQYYLEHMMDYAAYRESLPPGTKARDEDRHLLTLRLTKLLLHQDLTLSLFTFFSPSDQDVYLRPRASYDINDNWTVETGGNLFAGEDDYSFFGQFQDNSNWYLSLRYSF